MSDPVTISLSATDLLSLKTATEWLTGFYEGASSGKALPAFVFARLAALDGWIEQTGGVTQGNNNG